MIQVYDGDGERFESLLRVNLRYVEFKRRDDEVPEKGGRKFEMWFSTKERRDDAMQQLNACVTRMAMVSTALQGDQTVEHECRMAVTKVDPLIRIVAGHDEYGIMLTGIAYA